MPEPILTKLAMHAVPLTDFPTEPIQFLNVENCVREKKTCIKF